MDIDLTGASMDNVIFRNICHEIMRECHNKGIKISQKFSSYYMKLLLLDPKWNISLDKEDINRIDLQKLVRHALEHLMQEDAPSVVTLKMQMYFNCSFDTNAAIIDKHRQALSAKLVPLEAEIVTSPLPGDDEELTEKLFKKIVYYLTLYYGLGDPTDAAVYKEAYQALKSVFFKSDFEEFTSMKNRFSKMEKLKELAYLLAGVRLFNRDCNKGGKGIEDLPVLLTQAIDLTSEELQETLNYVMGNVNILTTALDQSFVPATRGPRIILDLRIPQTIDPATVEYAKDLLVLYRQYEVYARKMQVEIDKLDEEAQDVFDDFQWCLIESHQCVQYKTAVPAAAVYPLFNKLAETWRKMQNMVICLSKLTQIMMNLQTYVKKIRPIDDELRIMIGDGPILTDAQRLNQVTDEGIVINEDLLREIKMPADIENFEEAQLQLLGFCIWEFVESQGALIPGNPELGVVEVDNRLYVFASRKAAQAFIISPKRYIYEALDIVRRKPELANFLHILDQLEAVKGVKQLVTVTVDKKIIYEVGTQTDNHAPTVKKNPNYLWNVWDLKRRALSMANVSRRKTHSTQTVIFNNRNSVRLQTHFTRDHCYQTKKDNSSNVPTQSNYIFGLRGRKDDRQFIITLTRPCEE
ncbi:hypothetical protein Trydic_g17380 [Trypoxylus dichotomus]